MRKTSILFSLFAVCFAAATSAGPVDWWQSKKKEEKLKYTVIGSAAFVAAYGAAFWDYGEYDASWNNEGWFGQDTHEGGADKFGHFWTSYTLGRSTSALYRSWGFSQSKAALYAALSSAGIMTFMELGDTFSRYGFSPEDLIMNSAGTLAGYYLDTHPEIADKLDFRIDYNFEFDGNGDLLTDYENLRYLVAVKLSGFDSIENPILKQFELQAGYYARGYSDATNLDPQRYAYVGIGINISNLLERGGWRKTAKIFNFFQPSFSSARHTVALDN